MKIHCDGGFVYVSVACAAMLNESVGIYLNPVRSQWPGKIDKMIKDILSVRQNVAYHDHELHINCQFVIIKYPGALFSCLSVANVKFWPQTRAIRFFVFYSSFLLFHFFY